MNDMFLKRNTEDKQIRKCKQGKGKVFPLQARLWPRGWVEV